LQDLGGGEGKGRVTCRHIDKGRQKKGGQAGRRRGWILERDAKERVYGAASTSQEAKDGEEKLRDWGGESDMKREKGGATRREGSTGERRSQKTSNFLH